MLLNASDSSLLIIDVQEKLFEKIHNNILISQVILDSINVYSTLDLPIIYTEQYPKGLGPTIESIKNKLKNLPKLRKIEKTSFSCFYKTNKKLDTKQVVIVGIETHICVLQTAFDLQIAGHDVFMLEDAVGSRKLRDKEIALERAKQSAIKIVSLEMLVFELLRDSKHKHFKELSNIIK